MTALQKYSSAMAGIGLALSPVALIPAHAAPPVQYAVQILDPSGACSSWTTGGTILAPTITCVAAGPPVAGVPVCSITANGSNPLTISASGPVALSANCTNADGTTTFAWTGNGASPTTPAGVNPGMQSLTVNATTTFGVVATNATGSSVNKSVTVTLDTPTPPPPPPPPSDSMQCSGFANTIVWDMPWASSSTLNTQGFGGTTALVVRFTVPAAVASTSSGTLTMVEWTSSAYRYATITTDPCDFSPAPGAPLWNVRGPGANLTFNVTVAGVQGFNKVLLKAGQTYYLNIRNTDNFGNNSCPTGFCEAHVEFHKPDGT